MLIFLFFLRGVRSIFCGFKHCKNENKRLISSFNISFSNGLEYKFSHLKSISCFHLFFQARNMNIQNFERIHRYHFTRNLKLVTVISPKFTRVPSSDIISTISSTDRQDVVHTFSSRAFTSASFLCFFDWNGLFSNASIFGSPLPVNN